MANEKKSDRLGILEKELSSGNSKPQPFSVPDSDLKGTLPDFNDLSSNLAINKGYFIEVYHLISRQSIFFKAFLTDFADNFSVNYNKEQVFGRTDPIQVYQGTERTINLAFDLVSSNLDEAVNNLEKSNKLISMMYPEYGGASATQLKNGPLFKVKMGNLICKPGLKVGGNSAVTSAKDDGLACTIDGFKYDPDVDAGFFDPAPGLFYPQTIKIDLQLAVLHEESNEDNFIGWEKKEGNVAEFRSTSDAGAESNYPHAHVFRGDTAPDDGERGAVRVPVRQAGPPSNREPVTLETRNNNIEKGVFTPVPQNTSAAIELGKELVNERLRVQANKILSPQDRKNLSSILKGKFMDTDFF